MRLTEILKPACVKVPLDATDKEQALYELVDVLASQCDIPDAQQLKDAVWQREQTRTTGIGHGIGIPHGKTAGLTQLNMAIGLPASPIEFGAIDGKPVELIILLASPTDQTGPHIQALAKISRLLTDDDFRDAVKQATSAEQLYDMLAQQEAAIAGA
ncbi:MAG: PTS sugar transporter subunit IIA [Phycisphaerales bacterium JB063]